MLTVVIRIIFNVSVKIFQYPEKSAKNNRSVYNYLHAETKKRGNRIVLVNLRKAFKFLTLEAYIFEIIIDKDCLKTFCE